MYGLSIIRFPSGRYGYVGRIPTAIGYEVSATKADVMGQRAHKDAAGKTVTWKFPTFATAEAAQEHARQHGFEPAVC